MLTCWRHYATPDVVDKKSLTSVNDLNKCRTLTDTLQSCRMFIRKYTRIIYKALLGYFQRKMFQLWYVVHFKYSIILHVAQLQFYWTPDKQINNDYYYLVPSIAGKMCVTCQTSINYCRIISSVAFVVVVVVTKICIKLNDIDIDNDNDDYESVTSTRCRQAAIQSTNMYSRHTQTYSIYKFVYSMIVYTFTLCPNLELEMHEMLLKCLWLIETAVRNSLLLSIIFLWHIAKTPCRGSCFLSLLLLLFFFCFATFTEKKFTCSVIRENNGLLYPKRGGNILFIVTVNSVCTRTCV